MLGPAGLLRERIEAGEPFDLFASTNMAHPQRLVTIGLPDQVVCFARNRLCILARAQLELTPANLINVLSDPETKIGTSTPGDDPSGDYAFEMFDRIEAAHPGKGEVLKSRALQLVGGRRSPPGRSAADLFVGYASNAGLHRGEPALSILEVPFEFSADIAYGLALRKDAAADACSLWDFSMSKRAQQVLSKNGFLPRG
ncbi:MULTISPECIES: substrate-binding domain-containing protein [unclassified Ensifer]|uniref:substrate-binding domain-containing protein n=1 Tax=unclassified Ensifer TaxID=2633371 RepID=UPI000AB67202|nr:MULTISPECIES: substrate-binding domain-containing protein [unclassified Ensifer]